MTSRADDGAPRDDAAQRRDQALRDLLELDRQLSDGELSAQDAAPLRQRYEREAATAIAEGAATPPAAPAVRDAAETLPGRHRRWQPRHLLYGLGVLALLAAGLQLPGYLANRPSGGLVSGNEAFQPAAPPAGSPTPATGGTPASGSTPAPGSPRNLEKVTDAELEAVIAANPNVIGMRLALAARYTDKGRYDLAVVHYTTVLKQDPANAEAKAHLGWILLRLDRPTEAARLVDEARAADPNLIDAMWFQANVRLYGLNDPKGALATLDVMRQRPELAPVVRRQVEDLRRTASQRLAGTR